MWMTDEKSKAVQSHLKNEIEKALKQRGLSARKLSIDVVGHDGLIRDLRAGRMLGADRVASLADALGLEFYFGPKRETGSTVVIDRDEEYAHIPVHDVILAAGPGALNHGEEIVDFLAFRRDWLRGLNLDPALAVIARAMGDSMQPCISDGDLLLIDRSKTTPPPPSKTERASRAPIFALVHNGEAKVKRVQLVDAEHAILLSDNPDHSPVITNPDTLSIIGKVVWWGHTVKD